MRDDELIERGLKGSCNKVLITVFIPLQLIREMDGHGGFVNTICFDPSGTKLLTCNTLHISFILFTVRSPLVLTACSINTFIKHV
jgi:WD40 repeat protein